MLCVLVGKNEEKEREMENKYIVLIKGIISIYIGREDGNNNRKERRKKNEKKRMNKQHMKKEESKKTHNMKFRIPYYFIILISF